MSLRDAQMKTEGIRHNGMVFQSFEVFLTNAQVKYEDNANSASVITKAIVGFQYWFYEKCRFQVQYVYKNAYVQNGVFRHGANHGILCQMQIRVN